MTQTRSEAIAAGLAGEPTARQLEVLACIRRAMRETGLPPTIREIGAVMGIASPNGVTSHLKRMVRKGLLRAVRRGKSRCYVPVAPDGACPCCGRPMAGEDDR